MTRCQKAKSQIASERDAIAAPYQPNPREQEAIDRLRARSKLAPLSPRIKSEAKGGSQVVTNDHADEGTGYLLLMDAFGTVQPDFAEGLISQLVNVGSPTKTVDVKGTNFALSIVKGIQPKDEVEAMLATQMAAVHLATMTFARRLAHVENIPQQDSAERAFNKLARTFAAQAEALKRYRTGGQQSVTVRHVTVAEGGQAIVGNVNQGQNA